MRLLRLIAFNLAFFLSLSASAEPFEALVEQGFEAFQQEEWDTALKRFVRARELRDSDVVSFNIARTLEKMGYCVLAGREYQRLSAKPELDRDISAAVRERQNAVKCEDPDKVVSSMGLRSSDKRPPDSVSLEQLLEKLDQAEQVEQAGHLPVESTKQWERVEPHPRAQPADPTAEFDKMSASSQVVPRKRGVIGVAVTGWALVGVGIGVEVARLIEQKTNRRLEDEGFNEIGETHGCDWNGNFGVQQGSTFRTGFDDSCDESAAYNDNRYEPFSDGVDKAHRRADVLLAISFTLVSAGLTTALIGHLVRRPPARVSFRIAPTLKGAALAFDF